MLAELDVICSLANLARSRDYCRPAVNESREMTLHGGRHPVLDVLSDEGTFVPNDTELHFDRQRLLLITGPNMAGKSTFLRQNAHICFCRRLRPYPLSTLLAHFPGVSVLSSQQSLLVFYVLELCVT